jgi:hypothetical protein
MNKNTGKQRLLQFAALLITFHTLLAYGLPPLLLVSLTVALGIWFWRTRWQAALSVSLALVVATLLYGAVLTFTPLGKAWYYRPHEVLATWDYDAGHRRYRPDATLEMRMPHGDLQNLTRREIARPRDVVFQTDALGWRNVDRDGPEDDWVLVGDSFIAGLGDSQDGLVEAWLRRDHGINAYNLGYTGDPTDFAIRVDGFRRKTGSDTPLVLFLFEGNDFPGGLDEPAARKPSGFALFWKRYYRLFHHTDMYRFTSSLIKRVSSHRSVEESSQVLFRQINQDLMAFYAPYDVITREAQYAPDISVEKVISKLAEEAALVVFIPTKSRVYETLSYAESALPHARWEWLEELCVRHRWSCVDLTPALVEAAKDLADRGDFVWWPDDTHWNANGMAVAARVVAENLPATQSVE